MTAQDNVVPLYFFDIKDGRRLVDPSGTNCGNEAEALERARRMAKDLMERGGPLAKGTVVVVNEAGLEIGQVRIEFEGPGPDPPGVP